MKIQNKSRDALRYYFSKLVKSIRDVSDLAKDVIEYDNILFTFLVKVARGGGLKENSTSQKNYLKNK